MKRICIMSAGHLSTCPRMLNAADALTQAGYYVRFVSARYSGWAWAADQDVRRSRSWNWECVNYDRHSAPWAYLRSGIRFHSARRVAKNLSPSHRPVWLAQRAYARAHSELVSKALAESVDLFYAGTSGALAAAGSCAAKTGVPYALDLEDFHSTENSNGVEGRLSNSLAEQIESALLKRAAFLTAGSDAMAEAYRSKYDVSVVPRHNVFPLPKAPPDLRPSPGNLLRAYWFGQTIGAGRGLETAVHAMGKAQITGEFHLRGRSAPEYVESLCRLAREIAPGVRVVHHQPAPPDLMVGLCSGYDIGFAIDEDRELSLTNKALTYVLGGLAPALANTIGQRNFSRDLGTAALLVQPGDVEALAAGLRKWSEDKAALAAAKAAAWEAAKRRWHWEHPAERGALLQTVEQVFR